tara:strand:- start:30 stop:728 length:699 start_codon:yes stop_codon:yes gene_type:complete
MKDDIIDDCYGKQIDYYNQLPNSSKAIEEILERLEKAESQNEKDKKRLEDAESKIEKYKKYLFSQLEDFELNDCSGEYMLYYSDGEQGDGGGGWGNVKVTFKVDKEKNQVMIDLYEKYKMEWVINPNDPFYYKLKEYDYENVEKITYETETVLFAPAILDINDCESSISYGACDIMGPAPEDSPKSYWFFLRNKADWGELRKRPEISYINIPEKYKNDKNFKILFELMNKYN